MQTQERRERCTKEQAGTWPFVPDGSHDVLLDLGVDREHESATSAAETGEMCVNCLQTVFTTLHLQIPL